MEYPWYTTLKDQKDIQQGDIIPGCPIVIPPNKTEWEGDVELDITLIDSIILTQSCDLENDKIEIVLVCPYYSLKTFIDRQESDNQSKKAIQKTIDNLRKGHIEGYHLLNKCEGIFDDYQIVDFRNVYGIHFYALRDILSNLKNRSRLLPPYREHLSQAFARFFMRVGLPQDIIIDGY